ncbi:hypothetical protein [Prosthecobacter sp.]|uniref:hypothetical protein n=1 Tax=Prosthecobacter sp. TaxID=1965333 RepID=UPI003782FC83
MGPTAEVITAEPITDQQLLDIDDMITKLAAKFIRTRKGRVWSLWIDERPIHLSVTEPGVLVMAAGLHSPQDYDILRQLGQRLADLVGGLASEPIK